MSMNLNLPEDEDNLTVDEVTIVPESEEDKKILTDCIIFDSHNKDQLHYVFIPSEMIRD